MEEKRSKVLHVAGYISFYTDGSTDSHIVGLGDSGVAGSLHTDIGTGQFRRSRLYISSRAATHISTILQERFTDPYHYWFEVPLDVRDIWWREFQMRMGPSLSMTKMRHAWEVEIGYRMRYLFGDAKGRGRDLTRRFSKSRHLEELHKHQSKDKKGQYVDLHSEEFWVRFHEAQQKVNEEAADTDAPLPNDL
ncbi:hypothetical protein M9H77_27341 [Catharanthus roseus]|uniref:Uncharacterized protein n=1 Tax=Catharanthus roseus TaxID=4058 RepID=A0ACC0AEZ3_CATRO|nr:hypothetical protein M9H77_27341 [Catharanthus roseus]